MNRRCSGIARIEHLRCRSGRLAAVAAYEASIAAVSRAFGVEPEKIRSMPDKSPDVVRARQATIYLAIVAFDRPLRAISRVAGISAPGALKSVRRVEDRRDVPAFDSLLDALTLEIAA